VAARSVAAGILVSRLLGFVRERLFAHYFGNSVTAGAFRAALRIPNVIRNLLGEGTLSASFIPTYSGLLARGDVAGARALAGAILGLLVTLTALAAGVGVAAAPLITDIVAPGLRGDGRDLTVTLVRILFPMSGVLILSAWCLGILNAHGRFFLGYAAPALWNVAQIAVLVAAGASIAGAPLAIALAFGALAGGVLQFAAQLPTALRAVGGVRPTLDTRNGDVRRVVGAWIPVVVGAGVVQVSAIVDTQLASLLGAAAIAQLGYAQLFAVLPVSLFGVSVAAAALPALSRDVAGAADDAVRGRIATGLNRIVYWVVPCAVAFALLGPALVAGLFQTGAFGADDTALVSGVLAAYAIGVLAQAAIKLLASGFYALGDTRTPVRVAIGSVALAAGLGAWWMQYFLAAGIALGAAAGAWVNVSLLVTLLRRRTGRITTVDAWRQWTLALVAALAAGAAAAWVGSQTGALPPWAGGALVATAFALLYLGVTRILGHPEAPRGRRRTA
jgi:putative peptidoglycan lipid II flippase